MGVIRVGIGGWTYAPWRGVFYPDGLPQKRELDHASRQLTSIEINGTFYGSQKPETFAKWRDETPEDFVFALKAPGYATNRRVLADAGPSIERFFASGVLELGGKLGPVNWQFATTKTFDPDDLNAFLALLPREVDGRAIRHAIELRHPSFAVPDCIALAREHGVAIVIAGDGPHPQIADSTAPFVYTRIMGTDDAEPEGYPPVALDLWASRARAWASGGRAEGLTTIGAGDAPGARDVFLYVIGGAKHRNPAAAQALIRRLRQRSLPGGAGPR